MGDEEPHSGHGRGSLASISTLAHNPVRKGLSALQKRYPFLAQPTHELYPLVQACDEAIREGDNERAADDLMRIEQEVEHEENTLTAAFNLFKPSDSDSLRPKEIKTMMEYLGFPAAPADVEQLLKVVDKDGDGTMSFREFHLYVGRMGGSHELFKIRRGRIKSRMGAGCEDSGSDRDPALLAEDLKAVGIMEQEQAYWQLVLPSAPEEFSEAARLVDCQKSAVRHIRKLAKNNHEKALPVLQRRVREMKYSDNDLWMALAYIRELAPILLHVNLDKMMPFFEKDTHYRNQFETATSGGLLKPEVRVRWERDLFGGCYDSASGFERCKYGVLNAMNDHRGVVKCKQYGDSYLVLKDVRLRCTFSPEDSANLKAERLAVLDYYGHVLNEYSNDELEETIKIAKSSQAAVLGDSSKVGNMKYKETQIHGEVSFAKHVERLVAHQRHRNQDGCAARLAAICKKHGWQLSWMDEEQQRMQNEEMSKLGEDAWKQKLKAVMDKGTPDVAGVPPGFCRKGCGRKVAPGCTDRGRPFTTCCRGCALGFGHDLTCGNIDPELVKPGMCLNGCGRPVNPGRTAAGRRFTTCCRGCGRGEHDKTCGQDADSEPLCKFGCGRKVAQSTGGRRFDTCCRACATSKEEPRKHDATCRA
mmetsp:Transcript_7287/g.20664  ORF Transcript_7287/g.20664 Transcript_7287/m.20664 type:complete len:645 (+) Transcript_7287:57-1991(+)